MEQWRDLLGFGIDACQVGAFVQIAINAGAREVGEVVASAMHPGNKAFEM